MKKKGQRTFNYETVHGIKMLGLTLYPLYSPWLLDIFHLSLLSRGMRENSGNESLNVAQETLQTILQCSSDRLDPTPLLSLHMRRRCSALSPRKFVATKQRITS